MKYLLAIVATLALSACGAAEQKPSQPGTAMDAAHAAAQAAIDACKKKHASGELKSYVDTALCANPRVVAAYQKGNYPYMDLVYLGVSAKLAGAAKVDAGLLTEDQVENQFAELRRRVAAEEMRRRNTGAAPADGSAETLLAGLSAFAAANGSGHVGAAPAVMIHGDPTLASTEPTAHSDFDAAALPPPADEPAVQAPATATPAAPAPSEPRVNGYRLQFGVFAREENAARLTKAITTPQAQVSVEAAQDRAGRTLYYVRTSAYADLGQAQVAAKAAQAAARSQGFKERVSYVVLPVGDAR